jgi:nucleotide-binding universal stress UspA family protein
MTSTSVQGPIVAGVGAGGAGTHAAQHAASLAQALGVPLVLVFGYDISQLGPRGGALEEQLQTIADEETEEVRAAIASAHPGLELSVELVRDRPVDSLLRAAEVFGAQMIVVGHGGAGPLRAALLGSTAYETVHRGTVPVLVVPDPDDDPTGD